MIAWVFAIRAIRRMRNGPWQSRSSRWGGQICDACVGSTATRYFRRSALRFDPGLPVATSYVVFQTAKVGVPRELFADILRMIAELRKSFLYRLWRRQGSQEIAEIVSERMKLKDARRWRRMSHMGPACVETH